MGADNKYWKSLELFAYETYMIYKLDKASYIDLKPAQIKKLKMISVVALASKSKDLFY
jgi:COP9 signalosome complex subunit 7